MRKIVTAVAIIAGIAFVAYCGYNAAKSDAYAEAHDCSWRYDEAGFRGACLPNK